MTIAIEIENGVMRIEFCRLQKKNALTQQMYQQMTKALELAQDDDAIKAILWLGQLGVFCAGNDIADFLENPNLDDSHPTVQFLLQLAKTSKPMLAFVDGLAIGIGATLLLHCDFVWATPAAFFQFPFTRLGLCAEAGSSVLLPKRVGALVAQDWLLTGRKIPVEEAVTCKLINGIGSYQHVLQHAEFLATLPSAALQANKVLLKERCLEAVIKQELHVFSALLASAETQAGLAQFFNRA